MENEIKNFAEQFGFEPAVVHAENLLSKESASSADRRFVLCGMGGSHLAAGLLKIRRPSLPLIIHRDYGLPPIPKSDLPKTLFIASSYSGNTEEVLDFAEKAFAAKLSLAAIAVGGKLLDFAEKNKIPYIKIPDTHVQPRLALGFDMVALAKIIDDDTVLGELSKLQDKLKPSGLEVKGEDLAEKLKNSVPVIYASTVNSCIAYNWKIKFNETGKIPAFSHVFPEFNHNEMTGFDVIDSTRALSKNFHFIFLKDQTDHPQIKKRMKVCAKLYRDRGLPITEIDMKGDGFLKIFNSLLLADWTAFYTSKIYGTEAEQVPMVEEFKRLIV